MTRSVLFVGVAVLGACSIDESYSSIAQEERCPWNLCNNSPEIAHHGVWEQNVRGLPDRNGISIRSSNGRAIITRAGIPYQLWVSGGRIFGVNKAAGWISGTTLEGSTIDLFQNSSLLYSIYIARVRPAGTSFAVGTPSSVETYTMLWLDPGSPPSAGKALCNSVIQPTADAKTFELYGMLPTESVVFEGDRIDADGKTMNDVAEPDWFNFGCAGHTLAKLYLTRNTIFSQPTPNWAQRQTTLKMLVGDYCGRGQEYTAANEPIAWKGGLQPSYPSGATLVSLDARWNEEGATCIGDPRVKRTANPTTAIDFPDPLTEILAACPERSECTNLNVHDLDGAKLVSANRD
jgi:hypothetical protein